MGAEKKWLFTLFSACFVSLLLFLSYTSGFNASYYLVHRQQIPYLVPNGRNHLPAFAYYISGGRGHKDQVFQLLLAVYHPRNRYLLHLGSDASSMERDLLAVAVRSVPAIRAFGNVDVMGTADPTTYMGSTNIVATLHAASILLKVDSGWSWFFALNALDYPLITQDDLADAFSSISRDVNFIDHTSELGWKEHQRVQPIVVDPGIYLARKTQIFHATERRPTPDAFKFFTGSPWVTLSRSFLEFCVLGWDNLPRTLLMYFNNVILPQEGYFHSVICNSAEFRNTTVNHDLRFVIWDSPPKMDPRLLTASDYPEMVRSGAVFARQINRDDPVLTMIDEKILNRKRNRATPGAWCADRRKWLMDPCSQWGDIRVSEPGLQAKRLKEYLKKLVFQENSLSCR